MKKLSNLYLAGASFSTLLAFSLPISNADATCTAMPTCAELGYTDTDCGATPSLKCPFDSSQIKCICDSATFTLYSCDDNKGECMKCAGKYKYELCNTGYTLNEKTKNCDLNDCSAFPYASRNAAAEAGCDRYDACMEEGGACVCYSGGLNNAHYKCSVCVRGILQPDGTCKPTYNVGDLLYYKGTPIAVITAKEATMIWALALEDAASGEVKFQGPAGNVREEFDYDYCYSGGGSTCQAKKSCMLNSTMTQSTPYPDTTVTASKYPAYYAARHYAPSVCSNNSPCQAGNWWIPNTAALEGYYQLYNSGNPYIHQYFGAMDMWSDALSSHNMGPGGDCSEIQNGDVINLVYGSVDPGIDWLVDGTNRVRAMLELETSNSSLMKDFR